MGRVRIKAGVSLAHLRPEMQRVLVIGDKVYAKHKQELWITEHMGGEHAPNSLHYSGYALDLRSRFFSYDEQLVVVKELQEALGVAYDVIHHYKVVDEVVICHLHIEFDPK